MEWNVWSDGKDMEVDRLGSLLSSKIACPVHYPAYGKRIFECRCGVCFPVFVVAQEDWKYISDKHVAESAMALQA